MDPDDQPPVHIDLTRRSIVRIFNDKDWNKVAASTVAGGKAFRGNTGRTLRIDDKETVELDYSHLHPAMIYAKEGLALDRDAYEIGLPAVPRKIVKQTFNAMLNASERLNPIEGFDSKKFDISWQQLQHQIVAAMSQLGNTSIRSTGCIYNEKTRIWQKKSCISFPCEGIHVCQSNDSFIIHYSLEDELQSIMQETFHRRYGIGIAIKGKKNDYADPPTGFLDMSEPLKDITGPYRGYHERVTAFQNNRTWVLN